MKSSLSQDVVPMTGAAHQTSVIDLSGIEARMLPAVGGKAANLGELVRVGFPVPPGFCVTTAAYAQIAAGASIEFQALRTAPAADLERLAAAARESLLDLV